MEKILTTPTLPRTIALYLAAVWFSSPFVEIVYYQIELKRGSFPPEADTIMIPIMNFTISWIMLTPLIIIFSWWLLKNYPGKVSLFSWNNAKQIKSYAVTAVLVLYAISQLYFAIMSGIKSNFIDVISSIATAHVALIVRASIVMSKRRK